LEQLGGDSASISPVEIRENFPIVPSIKPHRSSLMSTHAVLYSLWGAAKSRPRRFARKIEFVEADQSDLPSPVPFEKKFRFAANPNHFHIPRRPVPQRGVSRSSRTRVGMRWTRAALLTRARACGRRSRVVLTPRRWRQVCGFKICRRRWQQSPITGESAEETVKTIACGNAG
jgi:hypothetical protein